LTLSIDVKFEVLTCRKNDIYTTSQNYLNASVPAGWMTKDKSLFVDDINTFTERYLSEGRYQLEFRAAQILIPTVDQPNVVQSILGKSKASAIEVLNSSLMLQGEPEIKLTPSFWQRLPFLAINVDLRTQ